VYLHFQVKLIGTGQLYHFSILKTYMILQNTKFNQGPPTEVTLVGKYNGSGRALGCI